MAISVDSVWQDREIRFDLDARYLKLSPGEILIEQIEKVEDTKGSNGDQGTLKVTNLRVIWYATSMPRINLSIGYSTINGGTTRVVNSKIRGPAESLYLMAKNSTSRFEFIFTCQNPNETKLFSAALRMHRAYETSKMFRDLKMRGSVITQDDQLKLLPGEQLAERAEGVWNLSSETGNLGVMLLTNIRVVWFASMNNHYNVSIPYLQLASCRIRDSRFGYALVIETSLHSGEYVLGFRIDPENRLQAICKTIQILQRAYLKKPNFGVQYVKEVVVNEDEIPEEKPPKDNIIIDNRPLRADAFAAYFTDKHKNEGPRQPVFSEELGVAIEELKPGFTLSDLWNIQVDPIK
ncbi:hypothetical protein QR680_014901 [Steinernema hermaphroditum]|uniref:BBSome complex member BBS5 PH domain-containing protein n=1 Tax=Steinernema hermaphroditum TaxID=289476 RepID=A0AA39IC21_9BILA|nr:hypothetical protein QR680_014901 [Steinernema hermaphroditum]